MSTSENATSDATANFPGDSPAVVDMFCRAAACSVVQIKAESGAAGKDRAYGFSLREGERVLEIPLVSGIFPANSPRRAGLIVFSG